MDIWQFGRGCGDPVCSLLKCSLTRSDCGLCPFAHEQQTATSEVLRILDEQTREAF